MREKLLFTLFYCSYALVHCSCPMNSAPGANPKKRERGEKAQTWIQTLPNSKI